MAPKKTNETYAKNLNSGLSSLAPKKTDETYAKNLNSRLNCLAPKKTDETYAKNLNSRLNSLAPEKTDETYAKDLVPVTHRRARYQGHCKETRSTNPWPNRERSGASGFEDKCGRDLSEGIGSFPCGRPDARQVTGSNTKGILERAAAGCNRKAPSVT